MYGSCTFPEGLVDIACSCVCQFVACTYLFILHFSLAIFIYVFLCFRLEVLRSVLHSRTLVVLYRIH